MVLSPLLGMFASMIPAMFIGVYGGMFFAMRDAMHCARRGIGATSVSQAHKKEDA